MTGIGARVGISAFFIGWRTRPTGKVGSPPSPSMLRFQVTAFDVATVDARIGQDVRDEIAADQGETPWVRAHGRTATGAPVTLWTAGFRPYLWVSVAAGTTTLTTPMPSNVRMLAPPEIRSDRLSLFGSRPIHVARLTLAHPGQVTTVRNHWHEGRAGDAHGTDVYEANVPFASRFAIDHGAVPFTWVEVPLADAFLVEDPRSGVTEAAVAHTSLRVLGCDGEHAGNAPLRLLAFDIETIGPGGGVPKADEGGEVIAIASICVSNATGQFADMATNVTERVVFLRGDAPADPLDGVTIVYTGPNEKDLLLAWARHAGAYATDIFATYNGDKYDWPFLLERAKQLDCVQEFRALSRVPGELVADRKTSFKNAQRGAEDDINIEIPGATNIDLFRWVRSNPMMKFRSYKLDAVAKELIDPTEGKVELPHQLIPVYYAGTSAQRRTLCEYCAYDAELVVKIILKNNVITSLIETARVTGTTLHDLITRGQGLKVLNQLWRDCLAHQMLVPTLKRAPEPVADTADEDDCALVSSSSASVFAPNASIGKNKRKKLARKEAEYTGAVVIEPIKGFYTDPITVLDFASLYPSIMIGHNLCYSTLVALGARCAHWRENDATYDPLACGCVHRTPSGDLFLGAHVRQGVLPRILKNLLSARSRAKRDMQAAKDRGAWFLVAVLDGRQLALKVSANSIYGFTGATVGALPCLSIASSVTAYGRQMIDYIQALVQRLYRGSMLLGAKVGAPEPLEFNANVVYGDTDSIMVKFGVATVAEAMSAGKHAASVINAAFRVRTMTTAARAAFVTEHLPDLTGESLEDLVVTHTERVVPLVTARISSDISITFEKVLWPYLLITKKRYAGGFYMSSPNTPDKIHQSGVESVRRDNSIFTAATVDGVLKTLMTTRDPVAALMFARQRVAALARGKLPLDDFVISKGYSKPEKDYARPETQVHLAVNRRREERDPGSAHKLGDRIPYVVVSRPDAVCGKMGRAKVKLVDAAEDIDYLRTHPLPPSITYYVEQQIRKPLTRIFDTIWGEGATDALLFTAALMATASATMASSGSLFGARSSAAASSSAIEPTAEDIDALRRTVNAWRARPKQSLFAMIRAPEKKK